MAGLFGRGRPRSPEPYAESSAGADFSARAREIAGERGSSPPALPGKADLAVVVAAAAAELGREDAGIRPPDSSGRPGGIVELPALPTVLVPDLHARPSFLASVLGWTPPGCLESLATLLEGGKACLVCLGDVFHSEAGGAPRRWSKAFREYASGWASRAAMDEEMGLSLAAARIVLEAKAAFPATFHYLKGNHDNIADEEGGGDHSFYKFAAEGEMVASWFRFCYGEDLLSEYRELELSLPLAAVGPRFVASHGEPAFALSRQDLLEYRSRPDVVEALIWTGNGDAEDFSVARGLEALLGPERAPGARWFAGHRPVDGRYALRAGGAFVQFHDPDARRVAYLLPDRDPDPDRDIFDIET